MTNAAVAAVAAKARIILGILYPVVAFLLVLIANLA
jgi:hypothetical protein